MKNDIFHVGDRVQVLSLDEIIQEYDGQVIVSASGAVDSVGSFVHSMFSYCGEEHTVTYVYSRSNGTSCKLDNCQEWWFASYTLRKIGPVQPVAMDDWIAVLGGGEPL